MTLTEEEAKSRWCPFARLGDEDGSTYNRLYNGKAHPDTLCLASGCTAWRREISSPKTGYCGLAGRPL